MNNPACEAFVIFILGYQGAFAEWCADLIAQHLQPRSCEIAHIEELSQLASHIISAKEKMLIVLSAHPGLRMINALLQSERKVIIIRDDPRHAVMSLQLDSGYDLLDAIRITASAAASAQEFGVLDKSFRGLWVQPSEDIQTTALSILSYIGVTGKLTRPFPLFEFKSWEQWWVNLHDSDQSMIEGALGYYWGQTQAVSWSPSLFFRADNRSPINGPLDITGRARCIIYGPRIWLVSGRWRVFLSFVFDESAQITDYLINEERASIFSLLGTVHPRAESAETSLDIAVDVSNDRPISLQLSNAKASFDGLISLGVVRAEQL